MTFDTRVTLLLVTHKKMLLSIVRIHQCLPVQSSEMLANNPKTCTELTKKKYKSLCVKVQNT